MEGTLTRYRYDTSQDESFVYRFEREAQRVFGSRHCLAMNSCTSALLSGLGALGIGPGDEVIVPGYTFIASIAAIVYAGATPVLAEIDDTLNLDPADVEAKITDRTRAIMAVHMLGAGADMQRLADVAGRHDLHLVEDVAQACGGSQHGRRLGAIGAFGAFSLNYFKVLTSGDGGFLLTGDEELYRRAYGIHDHGFRPLRDGASDDTALFGLNLRMSDVTGAIALAQLGKIDTVLSRTREVKARLVDGIGALPGVRRRRLVDADGDCALVLAYIFDSAQDAARVAGELDTAPLVRSHRHYYGNMGQLGRLGKDGTSGSAPFRRPSGHEQAYEPGALPATDSLLSRTIAIATGTSDWYSATSFGATVRSSDGEIDAIAERFRQAVERVCGR
ncbi:DegT/DnrJ/EryC1/StrS family aminotransferase [Paractinoplanes rishiriensis]|uniref:Glutamine--scyllo-inositol aminotransferase n=1 Tax=Paractinoplanes rishiriensis TaxID=1050105 RepID=A0A919JXU5_9ACTN|nr:DegT/DnrJ/EryC1/StrS family aminotransferase [Actinoplanes rishiriensis]GIE95224.1 glutamine--scyllo-inositol aminotransferase [Actinoplanes rishiriensis]